MPWLRLMVTQSLQDIARTPSKPAAPVCRIDPLCGNSHREVFRHSVNALICQICAFRAFWPFRLHLNRQAKIPLTTRWIPNLDVPNQGVIAVAPARLRQELYEMTVKLLQRHEQNIERLGV